MIPYESHHFLLCDVCSRGFELHGTQIAKAKQMNQVTAAYLDKQTTEEQYKMALNESRLLE